MISIEKNAMSYAVHHHWVPESYLRRWSDDGQSIAAFRVLVSHEAVPMWAPRSVKNAAARDHLYTTLSNPSQPDVMEKWLNEEVEQPALEAIERILAGRSLDSRQWSRIVRFAMALSVRSPADYLATIDGYRETIPGMLDAVLKQLPGHLKRARHGKVSKRPPPPIDSIVPLPLRVRTLPAAEPGLREVRADFSLGREAWLFKISHILTSTWTKVAHLDQKWSIGRPFRDAEWFTSDNPVLRLNYYGVGKTPEYDFKGGWANKGGEILLPLSPTHMLYMQSGFPRENEIRFDREQTLMIQRFMAENAFREIYAGRRHLRAEFFRRRTVDASAFEAEQREWDQFHEKQTEAAS